MFIRKNTTINTTIFDLELLSKEEKTNLFETIHKNYDKDLNSTKKETIPTFLSSIGVISNLSSTIYNYDYFYSTLFFTDIIDLEQTSDIFEKRNIKKSNFVVGPQKNEEDIIVTEEKTSELLNKYHSLEINALTKKVSVESTNNPKYCIKKSRTRNNLCNNAELEDAGYLLILEGMCSLYEIGDVINTLSYLITTSQNNIGLTVNLHNLIPSTVLDDILKKYSCFDTNFRDQMFSYLSCDKSNNVQAQRFENSSLLFENTDQKPFEDDTLNIFIPYTLYIYLPKFTNWFKDITKITTECKVNDHAKILVTNRTDPSIGYPKQINKSQVKSKYLKQQTLESILPNITTNNYKLINNITFIPANFSSRILKSKLKNTTNKSIVLKEYGNKLYNIPKSVLDGGYMSDLYFFTDNQIIEINKAKISTFHHNFAVSKDGLVNLSYYTNNIHSKLLNRFASEHYRNDLTRGDFICNLNLLCENSSDLKTLLADLKEKQNYLKETFNSREYIILTNEMFAYEKAVLLMLYLIKYTVSNTFGLKKDRGAEKRKDYFNIVIANNYKISDSTFNSFQNLFSTFVKITRTEKAYLLEALFIICFTKTDEEIIDLTLQIIKEQKDMAQLFIDRLNIYKVILNRVKKGVNFQHLNHSLSDTIFRKMESFKQSTLVYYAISNSDPVLLVKILLSDMSTIFFSKLLEEDLYVLFRFLYLSQENNIIVKNDKIKINCIANPTSYQKALSTYRRYEYEESAFNKTSVLKEVLDENVDLKNADLDVLLDSLLLKLKEYYISSLKNE